MKLRIWQQFKLAIVLLTPMLTIVPAVYGQEEDNFSFLPVVVEKAADVRQETEIPETWRPVDLSVSPDGKNFLLLSYSESGSVKTYHLQMFEVNNLKKSVEMTIPADAQIAKSLWHPDAKTIFLQGTQSGAASIWRGSAGPQPAWKQIYTTKESISGLMITPAIFELCEAPKTGAKEQHRLYFGVAYDGVSSGVRSVTEFGELPVDMIGPSNKLTRNEVRDISENSQAISLPYAVPVAFHPAGKQLVIRTKDGCYSIATYEAWDWSDIRTLEIESICGSDVCFTPNGAGLTVWKQDVPGIVVLMDKGTTKLPLAQDIHFSFPPVWTPCGSGLIGIDASGKTAHLVVVPVKMPLADVANAWMFCENQEDRNLFVKSGGLFRMTDRDQMYQFYDSENYYCNMLDKMRPTRPYLVTTDIFWEVFAASYEGLFQLVERQLIVPTFWSFVHDASLHFSKPGKNVRLKGIFSTLDTLNKKGAVLSGESKRISDASGQEFSNILDIEYDYSDLKPRGHYNKSTALQTYFKALRYMASIEFSEAESLELERMPDSLKDALMRFIRPYTYFIAPSRFDLAGIPESFKKAAYVMHAPEKRKIFPMSWGYDNEILNSVIFHSEWPEEDQILCGGAPRMLPSALDFAAIMGNKYADSLLQSSHLFQDCPKLKTVFESLKNRLNQIDATETNLYQRWLDAIGTQWADQAVPSGSGIDPDLWAAKRLQTGLASWATLRHATVLVNEKMVAECGEGGFEAIRVIPPLGAVEPDPDTFSKISALFDLQIELASRMDLMFKGNLYDMRTDTSEDVKQGIIRRLKQSKETVEKYRKICQKQIAAEPLSSQDYESIFYVGRAAEYNFLVFKSLATDDFALSDPDPMPKIADIAGGGLTGAPNYHIAVGRPLEWDITLPFFGRRQIVKGAVYSFKDVTDEAILTDADWLERVDRTDPVSWTRPFYSRSQITCAPELPF